MATAKQAVESLNDIFGRHPGARAAHARGTICAGVFTPTEDGRRLSRAAHMANGSTNVLVRFSNNAGDPDRPDYARRQLRGMATRFLLDGGAHTDVVAVTSPCFNARTSDDFVRMNRFFKRYPRISLRPLGLLFWVLVSHREAFRATAAALLLKPVPSYANCRYNSLHAFRWVDDHDRGHFVRYSWRPQEGERWISRWDTRRLDGDYLQQDLHERLGRTPPRPIAFRLELQLASVDDERKKRVSDPTRVWPDRPETIVTAGTRDRRPRFVTAGLLEVTGIWAGPEEAGEMPPFDPMPRIDGIEPSDDETLRFRPSAYDFSFRVRSGQERVGAR